MEIVLRVLHKEHAVRVDADLALKPIHDLDVVWVTVQLLHQFLVSVERENNRERNTIGVRKNSKQREQQGGNKPLQEDWVAGRVFAGGFHLDIVVHIARPPLLHSAGTVCVARLGNDDDRQLFGVFRLLIFKTMSKERENAQTGESGGVT